MDVSYYFSARRGIAGSSRDPQHAKPTVRLIATGGTIAHVRRGFTPDTRITGHELLQSIPQLGDFAEIEVEEFSKIGSGDFSTTMLVALAKRVNEIFTKEPDVSAVVVSIRFEYARRSRLLPGPDGEERQTGYPDGGTEAARNAGGGWRHESAGRREGRGRSADSWNGCVRRGER